MKNAQTKGAGSKFRVKRDEQSLLLEDREPVIRLRFGHHRLHYRPRVLRLHFELLAEREIGHLILGIKRLVAELLATTRPIRPLLFRATVPDRSALPAVLAAVGFLQTRHVYEPILHVSDVPIDNPAKLAAMRIELQPLSETRRRVPEHALRDLYMQVYSRISRLDPATPERLHPMEWDRVFLEDPQLLADLSCCAIADGQPVGLTTFYRGPEAQHVECGPFGVESARLDQHQELTLAMLKQSFDWLRAAGAQTVTAEIDSDDPWTLYTCAELPFRPAKASTSMVFIPAWKQDADELESGKAF